MERKDFIKKMFVLAEELSKTNDLTEILMIANDAEKLCERYEILIGNLRNSATRYFFVCTMGKNPNGTIGFNNFDIQTTYGHPTFRKCIDVSNEKFPNWKEVTLISISEISEEDWKIFTSQQ
jgi:hypothetical protein